MADQADKRTDIEKLLAEVDSVVDGTPARDRGSGGRRPVDSFGARMTARGRAAVFMWPTTFSVVASTANTSLVPSHVM